MQRSHSVGVAQRMRCSALLCLHILKIGQGLQVFTQQDRSKGFFETLQADRCGFVFASKRRETLGFRADRPLLDSGGLAAKRPRH